MALPLSVSIPLVFGICGLSTLALLYWDREPEKAQRTVVGLYKFLRRVFGWAAMMVIIPCMFILAIPVAMIFITLKAVCCEKASVRIKFD